MPPMPIQPGMMLFTITPDMLFSHAVTRIWRVFRMPGEPWMLSVASVECWRSARTSLTE